MAYSLNFYLDNALSKEKLSILKNDSREVQRDIQKILSERRLQIFLYLRSSGKTLKVYTERKCTQKQWDFERQKVNPNYFKSGSVELNKYIETVSYEVGKKFEETNNKGSLITKDQVKEIIES